MLKVEQIQTHDFVDKYRIKDGLILEVNKYKRLYNVYIHRNELGKVVRGCKDLRVLKEDYYDSYRDVTVPAGTFMYQGGFIGKADSVSDYRYELKSSGGSIYGSSEDMFEILEAVEHILNSY